jgi:hypothetical protein
MWVEMLKTKDQALECFKKIKLRAESECEGKLKALRTDWGVSSCPIFSQFSAVKVALSITQPLLTLHSRMV